MPEIKELSSVGATPVADNPAIVSAWPRVGDAGTVVVSSVEALRRAIADPGITTILVEPGRYDVASHDPAYYYGQAGIYVNRAVTIASASSSARADFHIGFEVTKGIFVVGAKGNVTFNNIGFFDTAAFSPYKNYAGIRAEGGDVTVLNSYFQNNLNGILGNGIDGIYGDLLVDNSIFYRNGSQDGDGNEHQIYWGGNAVHVEDSTFRESGTGHSIKTVVHESTTIQRNAIVDGPEGAPPIDVTGGGDLFVLDNVVVKQTKSTNGAVIRYDTLRQDGTVGEVLIEGNTFTSTSNPYGYATTILLNNLSDSLAVVRDNALQGNFQANLFRGDVLFEGNSLNGRNVTDPWWRANAKALTDQSDVTFLNAPVANGNSEVLRALDGGGGNDILVAQASGTNDDVFYGGEGRDILAGGPGNDYLFGEEGNDVLFAGSAGSIYVMDNLHGGPGDDYLGVGPVAPGGTAMVYLDGGEGNDQLDARGAEVFNLLGGPGNDTILGGIGSTHIENGINAGPGDDVVYGGGGRVMMLYGGDGTDVMVYAGAYGQDLSVKTEYGHQYVEAISGAGVAEVSKYGEEVYSFEYLQFANGVYHAATASFASGEKLVDLSQILANPVPAFPRAGATAALADEGDDTPVAAAPPPPTSSPAPDPTDVEIADAGAAAQGETVEQASAASPHLLFLSAVVAEIEVDGSGPVPGQLVIGTQPGAEAGPQPEEAPQLVPARPDPLPGAVANAPAVHVPYPETKLSYQAASHQRGSDDNERILTDTISNTQIWAGGGDDHISLSSWNVGVDAGEGDDVIVAQAPSVQLTGGQGADWFVFDMVRYAALQAYEDEIGFILDFTVGEDRIALVDSGFTSIEQLAAAMMQKDDDVEILIAGRILHISNATLADLTTALFLI